MSKNEKWGQIQNDKDFKATITERLQREIMNVHMI